MKIVKVILLLGGCLVIIAHAISAAEARRPSASRTVTHVDLGSNRYRRASGASTQAMLNQFPCLIITSSALDSAFQPYAELKTKSGMATAVVDLSYISSQFPGDSLQVKIRNCISYYHNTWETLWVILGGDIDVIPPMYPTCMGQRVMTDLYYSNLNHNWNENHDTIFGGPIGYGDTVDYYPTVFVGRIPCSTPQQATNILNKIVAFQYDTTQASYQARAVLTASDIFGAGMNECLPFLTACQQKLPPTITKSFFYQSNQTPVEAALNAGSALVVNISQSNVPGFNFLTKIFQSERYPIDTTFVKSMTNTGKYSVFLDFNCFGGDLTRPRTIGRLLVQDSLAGAAAFLGSSTYDFPLSNSRYYLRVLDNLYNFGMTQIGLAVEGAKTVLIPTNPFSDYVDRLAIFSYVLLGDPSMRVWTAAPGHLTCSVPTYLYVGDNVLTATVTAAGGSAAGAQVCLMKANEEYQVVTSDNNGRAVFGCNFPTTGTVSVVATKQNYFPVESDIQIITSPPIQPPSCPVLFAYDGTTFQQDNPLLTACEQTGYRSVVTDYYRVSKSIAVTGSKARFQIRELENEVSYLRELDLITVDHAIGTQVSFSSDGTATAYRDAVAPLTAVDNTGRNCMPEIIAEDRKLYQSLAPGYLIVTFPRVNSGSGFQFKSSHKNPCPNQNFVNPGGGADGKLASDSTIALPPSQLTLEYLDQNHQWAPLSSIPAREDPNQVLVPETGLTGSDSNIVTIRLSWTGSYATDVVRELVPAADAPTVHLRSTAQAQALLTKPTAGKWLGFDGTTDLVLAKGDVLDIGFNVADTVPTGMARDYFVKAVGRYEPVSLAVTDPLPKSFQLYANYPNPFNPTTTIAYDLPSAALVKLVVYDVTGREVKVIINAQQDAGHHSVQWNGDDGRGHQVATGVYLYRLSAGSFKASRKMLLLR